MVEKEDKRGVCDVMNKKMKKKIWKRKQVYLH